MENEKAVAPESYKPAEGPEKICGMSVDDKGTKCRKKPLHSGRCSVHPDPTATPVTVEAPDENEELLDAYMDGAYRRPSAKDFGDAYNKSLELRKKILLKMGATTKPIGDVEAVAQEIAEKLVAHHLYVWQGLEKAIALYKEITIPILSPFFAPAGPEKEKK